MEMKRIPDAGSEAAPTEAGSKDELEPPSSAPPPARSSIPWWRSLLYGLIVTVLFFGGLELSLRKLYPVARSATLPNDMIKAHLDSLAFRYDPDLYWYWPELPANGTQINRYGFRRKKPMTPRKPAGITRVVTLGDSQTLGAGVDVGDTYSSYAEAALGPSYEVLNAGISGYRSLNVYRLLQRRILYFQPDAVVIDCMPFDSPKDDGPLVHRPLRTRTQRLQALLWDSAIYHTMQLAIDKYRPNRARYLDKTGEALGGAPGREGNHALIAEWGKRVGVTVVFMQYAVWDADAINCHTRPGELPPGPPVVPACDYLIASKKAPAELFQDRNHLSAVGNQIVGQAVADTIRKLKR